MRRRRIRRLLLPSLIALVALAIFWAGAAGGVFAAADRIPPAPTAWVTDTAGFLSPASRTALDTRLSDYERTSGHQVLVWIGRTTGETPVEDWTVRAFAAWRIGRKGVDDGLALFLFAQDRTARIEVGYGLEDRVTDATASGILRDTLIPGIRAGNRDAAVTQTVDALIAAIEGRTGASTGGGGPPSSPPPASHPPLTAWQAWLIGVLAVVLISLMIRYPAFAWLVIRLLLSGAFRGGGPGAAGGGVGGGGGGFRGGGGRSGGGGATGRW